MNDEVKKHWSYALWLILAYALAMSGLFFWLLLILGAFYGPITLR